MNNPPVHVRQYMEEHPPLPHEMQALEYLFCRGERGTCATTQHVKTFMTYLRKDVLLLSYKKDAVLFGIFLLPLLAWAHDQPWADQIKVDRVCKYWFDAMEKLYNAGQRRHVDYLSDAIDVLAVQLHPLGHDVQNRAVDSWMQEFRTSQPAWLARSSMDNAQNPCDAHVHAWIALVTLLQEDHPSHLNAFLRQFGKATYKMASQNNQKIYVLAFLASDLPIAVKCRLLQEAFAWSLWMDPDIHALLEPQLPADLATRYELMPYFRQATAHHSVQSMVQKVKMHEKIVMHYCPQLHLLYSMLFDSPLALVKHANPKETVLSYLNNNEGTLDVGHLVEKSLWV